MPDACLDGLARCTHMDAQIQRLLCLGLLPLHKTLTPPARARGLVSCSRIGRNVIEWETGVKLPKAARLSAAGLLLGHEK